jgi:Yip1 domain
MSDFEGEHTAEPAFEAPGLSQWQRVGDIFFAPSKTFEDVKDGHKSWWLPFILMILGAYILFGAITLKIGWAQVAGNSIQLNPKATERMELASPDRRETTMRILQYAIEGSFAASPVLLLGYIALGSLGLWGTINFVFGGKASYEGIFTVWMFAGLPGIIKSLLGTIVLFLGATPESFNLTNFAPTSVGAFLNPLEVNPALYRFASALDLTTIWSMVLLGMGTAIVAKVKPSSGYIAVFGWWTIIVLIAVGYAAVAG